MKTVISREKLDKMMEKRGYTYLTDISKTLVQYMTKVEGKASNQLKAVNVYVDLETEEFTFDYYPPDNSEPITTPEYKPVTDEKLFDKMNKEFKKKINK